MQKADVQAAKRLHKQAQKAMQMCEVAQSANAADATTELDGRVCLTPVEQ